MSEQIQKQRQHSRTPEQATGQSHASTAEATVEMRAHAESTTQGAERTLEQIDATLRYLGSLELSAA